MTSTKNLKDKNTPKLAARDQKTDTVRIPSLDSKSAESARLLVLGADAPVAHALPNEGTVTVGRAEEADIRIDDASISRIHAVLTIAPAAGTSSGFKIRDLNSSNGTCILGKRLEPGQDYDIEPGDPIDVGNSTLIVKRGKLAKRLRRLNSHGFFEVRLEDECERAGSSGQQLAVVRVRVSGDLQAHTIEEALTAFLNSQDLIALYAPSEYEILLCDTSHEKAEQAAAAIRFSLARIGVGVQIGLACFPQDGKVAEELVAFATESVRGRSRMEALASKQNLIVTDGPMRELFKVADRVAASDISVLILGETGVGKEVMAKSIHARSKRASQSFVALNCGALSGELLESELFGHEKGAFTGAAKTKQGLLEVAGGGTVFLDEIGEMPPTTQVALLRVLEERRVRRVGGLESRPIDVRFIAATNRDVEKEIDSANFRQDLYYRLAGFTVVIPPLRERLAEIPLLATSFAAEYWARESRTGEPTFTREAMALLVKYAWPGNVRELRNVIERAVVLTQSELIGLEHLPADKLSSSLISSPSVAPTGHALEAAGPTAVTRLAARKREKTVIKAPITQPRAVEQESDDTLEIPVPDELEGDAGVRAPPRPEAKGMRAASNEDQGFRGPLSSSMEEVEHRQILAALEASVGNQTRAAKLLGISRKALIRRLDRYNVPRPRKGDSAED